MTYACRPPSWRCHEGIRKALQLVTCTHLASCADKENNTPARMAGGSVKAGAKPCAHTYIWKSLCQQADVADPTNANVPLKMTQSMWVCTRCIRKCKVLRIYTNQLYANIALCELQLLRLLSFHRAVQFGCRCCSPGTSIDSVCEDFLLHYQGWVHLILPSWKAKPLVRWADCPV